MDPATLALIIQTLSQLLGKGPENNIQTSADIPAGTENAEGGGFQLPTPGADTGISAIAPDTGAADALAGQFEALQAPASVPLAPAPVGAAGSPPPPPVLDPPVPPPAPAPPVLAETPPAGIGEILAANPEALLAVAQFLGLGQEGAQGTARAAPVPGGTQGSLIPGLQLPQSGQIGALLRQIPGLV